MDTQNILIKEELISYCGLYCGACPKFQKNECEGCKGDSLKCAVGFKSCKVRPCNIEHSYTSCADCKEYSSVKQCKKYNPLLVRFGQFISRTNRRLCIEMIQEKGADAFVSFMAEKKWITMKLGRKN